MKIFITRPNLPPHPFEDRCLERWKTAAVLRKAELEVVTAKPYEIHGELLTRLWNDIRVDLDSLCLISESDFYPDPDAINILVSRAVLDGTALTGCFSAHRDSPAHEWVSLAPLLAPWFLFFNRAAFAPGQPDLHWLGAAGPRNDAANLAYLRGVEAGIFTARNVNFFPGREPKPFLFGRTYPFGTHLMWRRHWHDDPERLLFPADPGGPTIGQHLLAIGLWFDRRA